MSTPTKDLEGETRYPQVLERKFSPEVVEKDYSRVVWMYGVWAGLTESSALSKSLQLANIRDGESILEVAVGTGIAFKKIVERNIHGRNDGIDISQSMLSAAIKRMKKCGISSNYRLQVGNAYSLPFGDCEFDLVINNYMLDLLPESDFIRILREFNRVLKSPGRVVIVSTAYGSKWYNHFWYWVAKHFPSLLTNCRPISIEKYIGVAGFEDINTELTSQNTIASEILTATKP